MSPLAANALSSTSGPIDLHVPGHGTHDRFADQSTDPHGCGDRVDIDVGPFRTRDKDMRVYVRPLDEEAEPPPCGRFDAYFKGIPVPAALDRNTLVGSAVFLNRNPGFTHARHGITVTLPPGTCTRSRTGPGARNLLSGIWSAAMPSRTPEVDCPAL
ncbi:MAG: hypothetical protein FJ314_10190 [SAR202 cluster bacterium]|nr:hypothetical protein [SAR202 cluster bacterium]